MGRMYVVLGADTEDNYPCYVPYWGTFGSDYDTNPADIRMDWVDYLEDLRNIFREAGFRITWFLRMDECVGVRILEAVNSVDDLMSTGDETGIHIHTLEWNGGIWRQTTDPGKEREIVENAINLFRESVGFKPNISRMGWNTMSNSIMKTLNDTGIRYDNTAVPRYSSRGMYGGRDNIVDWKRVKDKPYRPSYGDYQVEGGMKITEVPISSLEKKSIFFSDSNINGFIHKRSSFLLERAMTIKACLTDKLNVSPHTNFIVSPFWSNSNLREIIDKKVLDAKNNGRSLLAGYFHPADILDPRNGKMNRRFAEKLLDILSYIKSKDNEVEIIPLALSDAMKRLEDEHTIGKSP